MKKPILNTLMLLLVVTLYSQPSTIPSGFGTASDPYIIDSLEKLYWISESNFTSANFSDSKYFLQTADIDAADTANWTNGWIPIGGRNSTNGSTENADWRFDGQYNGNGHTISNLFINSTLSLNGLFGIIGQNNAIVLNLTLVDVNISSTGQKTGALVGNNRSGMIFNCSASGTVTSSGNTIGGLAGQNQSGTLRNSFSSCTVTQTSGSQIGGLLGLNQGYVLNCYAEGTVSGIDKVGGLLGSNMNTSGSNLVNSYANSHVNLHSGSSTNIGGLIGWIQTGNISNSNYWNTTKHSNGVGYDNPSYTFSAVGLNSSQLQAAFNFSSWDFEGETANGTYDLWSMGSGGYPTVYAAGNIWTGSVDSNWNNASNWSGNEYPNANGVNSKHIVTIPTGLANYPILTSNVTAYSVTIENGASITYGGYSLTRSFLIQSSSPSAPIYIDRFGKQTSVAGDSIDQFGQIGGSTYINKNGKITSF